MHDLRRIPVLACALLVGLRMFIGWQFLYEGMWKLDTLDSPRPWTSAGYLKNAQGPLRPLFRNMTGDPDELNWLDDDKVAAEWDLWQKQFLDHYPDLSGRQKDRLDRLINGPKEFVAELQQLPEGVEFRGSVAKAIRYDEKRKRLSVDGKWHLVPRERDRLLAMVTVAENPSVKNREKNEIARAFQKAVGDVYKRSSRLSFKERLAASLQGDPERAGLILEEQEGTIDYKRMGDIELYQEQLKRHENNLALAEQAFQHAHLKKQWAEIQSMRARLVGPIKGLDKELKDQARKLLTEEQLARGPVPLPLNQIEKLDVMTIWSLIILGVLLIAGLFSRLVAIGAAGLLLSFYLAMPPWPGVYDFQELPGPEHSYIIDKNMIEICALLAIAMMPTGRWFGMDALFARRSRKRRSVSQSGPIPPRMSEKPSESDQPAGSTRG